MVVERFGSNDLREIKDPPADYPDCIYCYAASKTAGMTAVSCAPVTEEEAKKLITTLGYAYN
jgi:hypothetical protein